MTQANALLGLLAETSIHAGAGSSTGIIDLPIQREGHNGWPCVFGSSVKGAFRDAYQTQYENDTQMCSLIFGPSPDSEAAAEHAGALAVSDARLLLLPIRSLTSQFKWVTCPAALQRLQRDVQRLGLAPLELSELPPLGNTTALTDNNAQATPKLFLEEYRFDTKSIDLNNTLTALAKLMPTANAHQLLQEQLVIIHNDMFAHLATHATPVAAHIRIKPDTKTVQDGALWYEETLPPETLLYTCINASKARKEGASADAKTILSGIKENLFSKRPYLQLGGNETVGMGWCAVKFLGE